MFFSELYVDGCGMVETEPFNLPVGRYLVLEATMFCFAGRSVTSFGQSWWVKLSIGRLEKS